MRKIFLFIIINIKIPNQFLIKCFIYAKAALLELYIFELIKVQGLHVLIFVLILMQFLQVHLFHGYLLGYLKEVLLFELVPSYKPT